MLAFFMKLKPEHMSKFKTTRPPIAVLTSVLFGVFKTSSIYTFCSGTDNFFIVSVLWSFTLNKIEATLLNLIYKHAKKWV